MPQAAQNWYLIRIYLIIMFSKATLKERRQYYREEWSTKDLPDFVIDKGLYSRKLNENDGKLIYKADDSIVMAALSYDGKYIYMCNGGAGSATQITNFIDEKIFVLNPDGTLVNTIELDRRKMSNLYYGDDKYLFLGYSNKLSYIDKSSISGSVEIVPVK